MTEEEKEGKACEAPKTNRRKTPKSKGMLEFEQQ